MRDRGVQRLALSPDEASAALGVSRDYFDEHIALELRIVRRGRRKLIAVAELERWLEREGALAVGEERRPLPRRPSAGPPAGEVL
jgi:excisionase family DNA binding protein